MTRALVAAALALAPATAWAGYPDVFGAGPVSVARAGSGVASSADGFAAWTNPAGLGFAPRSSVAFGASLLGGALSANGRTYGIAEPFAAPGALVVRPGGDHWLARALAFGAHVHVLPTTIGRIVSGAPDAVTFPYYTNRTQRLVLLPSVALRLGERLSVGLSLNYFAELRGPATASVGPTRGLDTTITEVIRSRTSVVVGARLALSQRWTLGAVYRQRFEAPYAVTTRSDVGGIDLNLAIEADGLVTPDELALGAHYRADRWDLALDLQWSLWSAWAGPFVRVQASLPGLSLAPRLPDANVRDTFAARAGATVRAVGASDRAYLDVHAGLGFESALVGPQRGRTNLVDGERVIVGLGVTYGLPRAAWFPTRARLSFALQGHALVPSTSEKTLSTADDAARDPGALADEDSSLAGVQTRNPGFPTLTGGGFVGTALAAFEVDL